MREYSKPNPEMGCPLNIVTGSNPGLTTNNTYMEKNRLVKALFSKYKAEMDDAIARLEIYAKNPVAIGEHPQHTEEMDKLVQQYCDAKDKMESLKEMIKELS
jgi:hypothetical protein